MAKSRTSESCAPDPNWTYEQAVAHVEETVARLEQGDLPLATIFETFEAAVTELRQCEAFLQEKQQQVDLLIETLMEE
ncbi:exodeoxyribonuclease VII small subunit [Leptolyngbya sp. PCC 6406]|uniref:exodeoxyribonuclease VII small subunit n=1 Tax=Leptolyngbya sp. PCC 6406 TaxID=1173264 RepID=UPI0002ACFE52|nr:exodeoxyribonuclease VII small subunit [Leptolyngbya sp. PCC 6406]